MIFLKAFESDVAQVMSAHQLGLGLGVQKFVDSEVIRLMEPYTPLQDGVLKGAPQAQSSIGSGKIVQQTPYAKRWYYTPANFTGAPMRGTKWFERMKADHRDSILRGAAALAGARK